MIARNDPVMLYVVPECPLCADARSWLKEHGVVYLERDVANDFGALRAMYELTRQRFVRYLKREVEQWYVQVMKSWQSFSCESTMRFSRNQIIGAIMLLVLIWLVIAIRLIISRG